jgi:hypothetical protein
MRPDAPADRNVVAAAQSGRSIGRPTFVWFHCHILVTIRKGAQ